MNRLNTNNLLWLVYLALLIVLLPHTAWAFSRFEAPNSLGAIVAWAAAFAFEASIAGLTHKLAKHIEGTPKRLRSYHRFTYRYLNAYSAGLVTALAVSILANLAHAVEFGQSLAIFTSWGIPFAAYAVAFGAVLPLTSLLFARVLSNVTDADDGPNPELDAANNLIGQLRSQLRSAEAARQVAEANALRAEEQARTAEVRFNAAGDLFARLFTAEKRQRILTAAETWPRLPASAIAIIAESSPSYVSEVLAGKE